MMCEETASFVWSVVMVAWQREMMSAGGNFVALDTAEKVFSATCNEIFLQLVLNMGLCQVGPYWTCHAKQQKGSLGFRAIVRIVDRYSGGGIEGAYCGIT